MVLRIAPFLVTLATLVAGRGLGTAITESFGIEFPAAFTCLGAWSLVRAPDPRTVRPRRDCRTVAPLTSMPILVFALVVARRPRRAEPHPVRPADLRRRQRPRGGAKAGIDARRILFSVYLICGFCAAVGGVMLIALIGRLNQTFGVGREFDVITAAVLGGASLFGGSGFAFGSVIGSTLVQTVQSGMIFIGVNLYLQPMVLPASSSSPSSSTACARGACSG